MRLVLDIRENLKQLLLILLLPLALTVVYAYFAFGSNATLLRIGRLKTMDFFMNNRYANSTVPDAAKNIVIINIDEDTFSKLKEEWPLNRGFSAYLIEKLSKPEARPRVVGIGLVYTGKSDSNESDLWLASAFKKFGDVALASYFNPDGDLMLPDLRLLNAAKSVGFINSPIDADQVIRRTNPFIFLKDKSMSFSFALEVFAALKGIDLKKSLYLTRQEALQMFQANGSQILLPANPKNWATRINFLARPGDFRSFSLWEVLTSMVPDSAFKDKIVLVGTNMEITKDLYYTPIGQMPSMYIHANFLLNMLTGRFLKELPVSINMLVIFVIAMSVAFIRAKLRFIKSTLLTILLLAGVYFLTAKYFSADIVIDFFGIGILALLSFLLVSAVEYTAVILENVKLKKLAITDGLTGLFIYRYFEVKLAKEINLALQQKKELSLVIFDIDYFKKCNDTYGHEAGNEVLKNVSGILRNRCRQTDTVCRFGGEEFVSILGVTDMERAGKYAEAIRKSVEVLDINYEGKKIKVTVSAGVSSLSFIGNKNSLELINSADKALYAAKDSGRNKTVLASQL